MSELKFNDERNFDKTIGEFYENCIGKQIDKIDGKIIANWISMLNEYATMANDIPIFWIRKYEGAGKRTVDDGSGKTIKKQDNRRGALTVVVDKDNNGIYQTKFAYAFVSNYDAHELYNQIREGKIETSKNFNDMMKSGEYKLHYDPNGGDCMDDKVSFFNHTGFVKGGVLSKQNWYLAHIHDVNKRQYINKYKFSNSDIDSIFFDKGEVSDWRNVDEIPQEYKCVESYLSQALNKQISVGEKQKPLDRHVRIIDFETICKKFNEKSPDTQKDEIEKFFKDILQARFFRFVHPYNYFLVPSRDYEVNWIYGKKDVSIGEYSKLQEYVNFKIIEKIQKSGWPDYNTSFFNKIMVGAPEIINDERQAGYDEVINISYGIALKRVGFDDYKNVTFVFKDEDGTKIKKPDDFLEKVKDNKNHFVFSVNILGEKAFEEKESYFTKKELSQTDIIEKVKKLIKDNNEETEVIFQITTANVKATNVSEIITKCLSHLNELGVPLYEYLEEDYNKKLALEEDYNKKLADKLWDEFKDDFEDEDLKKKLERIVDRDANVSTLEKSMKGNSKRNISQDDSKIPEKKLEIAHYYLTHKCSLKEVESKVLGIENGNGSRAKYHLDSLNITMEKKGIIVTREDIQKELQNSDGKYKKVLIEIQNLYFQ